MRDTFLSKLDDDLLEQFRGKPNTDVLLSALARQLDDLREFFLELITLRTLANAEGAQLDGIGEIAAMSRTEAIMYTDLAGQTVPMNDEEYRKYLAWKIALNTSDGTHASVYTALKMFWDKTPLYYSEDPAQPATMVFSTPTLSPEDDVHVLMLAPKIKAAGVKLVISKKVETEVDTPYYTATALSAAEHTVTFPELTAKIPYHIYTGAYITHATHELTFPQIGG